MKMIDYQIQWNQKRPTVLINNQVLTEKVTIKMQRSNYE